MSTEVRSRRAVLGAGVAAIAATAAGALGRAPSVRATHEDPDYVALGHDNAATTTTTITTTGGRQALSVRNDEGTAFRAASEAHTAVIGHSGSGVGISGTSVSSSGVAGFSGQGPGVHGASNVVGVSGRSPDGIGVHGEGSTAGIWGLGSRTGVLAEAAAPGGFALKAVGRAGFSTSGVATIAAGRNRCRVTGVTVQRRSFVLLTPMANLGGRDLWFTKDTAGDSFTIRISASRPGATKIAWLLLG